MADFSPAHPGDVLREDFLKPLKLSQYALAKAIGVPQIRVSEIVNGKRAITPDTALRLARYFRTSAEFWIGMQATYDLEMARDQVGAKIKARVQPRAA
jgi:addiction module HigA family antidote